MLSYQKDNFRQEKENSDPPDIGERGIGDEIVD